MEIRYDGSVVGFLYFFDIAGIESDFVQGVAVLMSNFFESQRPSFTRLGESYVYNIHDSIGNVRANVYYAESVIDG